MQLFSKKKKTRAREVVLVIDIGSASVGGALVLLDSNAIPQVLYVTRRLMVFQPELNFNRFASAMYDALRIVIEDIERGGLPHLTLTESGEGRITRILCAYTSPWYTARVKTLAVHNDKPFEVTEAYINRLVREGEKGLEDEGGADVKKIEGKGFAIERQIVGIKLGGYAVTHPYGRHTTDVSVTVTLTRIADDIRTKIEGILETHFPAPHVSHHSFLLAGFSVVRDLSHTPPDFLFIDISGEVTDVALVKNDALTEVVSFPYGKNALVRSLAALKGITSDEAEAAIGLALRGDHDQLTAAEVSPVLHEAKKKWMGEFARAVENFSQEVVLPNIVYVTADPHVAHLFTETLTSLGPQTGLLGGTITVHPVVAATLKDRVSFRGGTERDSFAAILATYFNSVVSLVY